MATETQGTAKSPAVTDQPPPPPPHPPIPAHPIAPYPPPPFNGVHYPPPGAYPGPFYTFAPVPDANHDPSSPNGIPSGPIIVAAFPPHPGMVYAFPPPAGHIPGYPPFPPGVQPQVLPRPKRKQVKMACTNCANACKRCDEARPCERCTKYGIAESCKDGVRKERKKGVKRGPYKRKSKGEAAANQATNGEGEHPAPQPLYTVPHEYGYPTPYFVHQPYSLPPPPPGDHPTTNGDAAHTNGTAHPQVIPAPMFPLHPAYPPYATYPHPYSHAPPHALIQPPPGPAPAQPQPQQSHHDKANGDADETHKGKKRGRPSKTAEESGVNGAHGTKDKKAKTTTAEGPVETNGNGIHPPQPHQQAQTA